MARNVEMYDGDILIRGGAGRESVVQVQLGSSQLLSINVSKSGPGDNQRRINVTWRQGPLAKDRQVSIGFAELNLLDKTMTGAHGEDLTR